MPTFMQALTEFSNYKLQRSILQSVISAKQALNLNCKNEVDELSKMIYNGPLVAASVKVRGCLNSSIYEEHPDMGEFRIDFFTSQTLARYHSLSAAKTFMTFNFAKEIWENAVLDTIHSATDSKIEEVLLIDQCGKPLIRGLVKDQTIAWEPSPIMDEVSQRECQRQIKELLDQAAEEARWDNFSSANMLRESARHMQMQLDIARIQDRMVH